MRYLWLFVGGGLGAVLRYELAGLVQARGGTAFPWGTFAVNAAGCFAIGIAAALLEERSADPNVRIFLIAGLLGGFTTFSTFGLETWRLLEEAAWGLAAGNVVGSVAAGLIGVVAGLLVGRELI